MQSGQITFSQAQGYEEIPGPLKLEEVPIEARNRIWSLFYRYLWRSTSTAGGFGTYIGGEWRDVFESVHTRLDNLPLDEWDADFQPFCKRVKRRIQEYPFRKVFDLIQFVLRHPQCPPQFVKDMRHTFRDCRLAYVLDIGPPPTIVPAVTPERALP